MRLGQARNATILLVGCLLPALSAAAADTTLVPVSANWKYLDNGSDQGTAWRTAGFNDSGWLSGPAQLGYGDGDEATVVSYGPSSTAKYITTYFRNAFTVADASAFASATLRLLRDDGAVVYLNGAEVFRSNMPSGTIASTTPASSAVAGADESAFFTTTIPPSLLTTGANVLAVEVHQESGTSSDVSFALELIGSTSLSLTRGPYLQSATPTSVVVRWRTSGASDSRVSFGFEQGLLNATVDDATLRTEHEIALTGLLPATKYYYSIGTSAAALASGADQFFWTPPLTSMQTPTRVWVLGDSGTADASAQAVRNAYDAYNGTRHTNLWLMLGDNAYENGTDAEYQAAVFDMYPKFLKQSVVWPTIGNHDSAGSSGPVANLPYHQMFTLPTAGQAGGLASGTEDYYSFDHANIHFICLNSMTVSRDPAGPMLTWLRNDLASTAQDWIIAFWHHPPYTKGTHDSDVDLESSQMRQNALSILESYGVDLVLTGHSHSYERSFLLDGHYGTSDTLTAAMKKNPGSGRVDGTGAYTKAGVGPSPNQGAVYAVAGSSGEALSASLNHPAMYISLAQLGSMILDVNGNRLDATFLRETGAVADYFTIEKGPAGPPPGAPTALGATATSSSQINLAWTDNASNETGFKIERSSDGVSFSQIATVGSNVTTHSNTGLAAAVAYSYRVRAYGGGGDSAYSNVATATTLPPALPAAPTSLVAAAVAGQINLTWTDNAGDESGFKIERSSDGVSFSQIATVGSNVTSYSNTGLPGATTYFYRLRAYNGVGDSGYSNVAQATTPTLAVYDTVLRAPKCASVGASCDSGTLLTGRAALGPEVNQPNTINGSCVDGTLGTFQLDESNDRIRVSTTDGSALAAGKTVRVDATVWAYSSFGSDRLDLYAAANANSPSWTLIATLAPVAGGAQVLSANYTLPSGALQAVRARFRYLGSAGSCGTGEYDDHDDLVFAVSTGTPDFGVSVSPASVSLGRGGSGNTTTTVTSLNGFGSAVSLSASGLPSGVTASFVTNPVTPPANGTVNSTLTLTASSLAATGTFSVTITGTSGSLVHSTPLTLTVAPPPDFGISVAPGALSVTQGGSGNTTTTVTSLNGFGSAVSLSASGLPSGVTASFVTNPVTPPANGSTSSALTLTASSLAATGPFSVTITGTSGSLVHSTTLTLTVGAAPQPDFGILVSPGSLSVTQGSSGSTTTTVTSLNGFALAVSLSASGLPSGVTASFVSNPVTPAANGSLNSSLTLTASSLAATGTFSVTVTGTSGSLVHSTTLTLTVSPPGPIAVFSDDAESATTSFTLTNTTTSTRWTRSTSLPYAGSYSWKAGNSTGGNYGNNGDARLTTPTLSLAGAASATLTYAFKHRTEANFDFFEVRISVDGGTNWTNLARVSGQSTSYSAWAPVASINLNAYAGQANVRLQFRLTSDGSITNFGVALDNVNLVKQ